MYNINFIDLLCGGLYGFNISILKIIFIYFFRNTRLIHPVYYYIIIHYIENKIYIWTNLSVLIEKFIKTDRIFFFDKNQFFLFNYWSEKFFSTFSITVGKLLRFARIEKKTARYLLNNIVYIILRSRLRRHDLSCVRWKFLIYVEKYEFNFFFFLILKKRTSYI